MAGTSRFHDKLHRANHHSVVSPGLPDSAYDPIASKDYPFRGDFVLSGALSARNDVTLGGALSARGDGTTESFVARKNLTVNEASVLRGPIYTNSSSSFITHETFSINTTPPLSRSIALNYANGVYINGTPPKLIVGVKGIDEGMVQVTNIDAMSAALVSATITDRLGIGTTDPQHELHVVGDVIIYGTLTANGNSYFQNTLFTTTSSLSIVNTGTGAGLTVSQEGNQPIVAFYDHESSISLWADGHADRPGWIGVKTTAPNVELTVAGSISSSSVVYGSNSNSIAWSSNYTTTNTKSGSWELNYTAVRSNSAKWDSSYTTTNTKSSSWDSNYSTVLANSGSWSSGGSGSTVLTSNSGKWNANYTTTNSNSAKWDSNYSTVLANSGSWGSGGAGSTVLASNSAKWDSNYSTVLANSGSWGSGGASSTVLASNSAKWDSNYTTTNTKSSSWDSNYSTVLANSASWSAGGGSGGASYATVNAFSANWNNSYNTLTSNSASWSSVYNTTTVNSAKWESNYTTTNTNSGNWNSSYVTLLANSGTWDSAAGALVDIDLDYLADVSITSNTLADGQVLVYDIGTQQWENSSLVLSAVVQGSSSWASSYSTTNTNSANWNNSYNALTSTSANWNNIYNVVTANSATWNTNSLSGSTDVLITSPTNNALLQYDTAQGKWVDGDTLITTGTLTAGSIDLTTAEISTYETELSANGDFLLLRINGVVRKLRLWD